MKQLMRIPFLMILVIALKSQAAVPISPVEDVEGGGVAAKLENEHLKVSFVEAVRGGRATVRPLLELPMGGRWVEAPLEASAESYQILSAPEGVRMEIPQRGFFPRWPDRTKDDSRGPRIIWDAGESFEAVLESVTQVDEQRLLLRFYPLPIGTLEGSWELRPGEKTVRVSLEFTPDEPGQFSLGYFLFNRKPLEDVDELLMPMLVNAKRFPSEEYTLLQTQAPTPLSLMQVGSLTWAVSGDRHSVPFEFPVPAESRYGLHIRNPDGLVQPSIYGPLVGTQASRASPGKPVRFQFRLLVEPGDWYAAYRTVADEVFEWRDYRRNAEVSLTDAALNMIDLYMDDEHSGWWERAKAHYQIESRNGSTQASPMSAISLYWLTGDPEVYQRRSLPTLEFILSRGEPHFSPIPEDTEGFPGAYPDGSMKGPVDIFGATVYGGLWELTNRRTTLLRDIAFPGDGIRDTGTQQSFESHNQPFDEWLGRYLFTGDEAALERAVREADEYIAQAIEIRPERELGTHPFFLMPYVPAWEGLLRLYEVTGEERFLEASAYGARMVMTGMWTQPTPTHESVLIHPDGVVDGDKLHLVLNRGDELFRLGWPRESDDTWERVVPGWQVSPVGLGFETPFTYTYQDQGGRMIMQAPWTSAFVRLAHYTGDRQFKTYARNAVVGRWSNYPGYYYTTFTDLFLDPEFPYVGPDMSFIYYHHILVHLSWTLDYLVSQAALRSDGAIDFPGLRQFGYAFFDNLVYGHAPGEVMGEKDVWLWFRRDLVGLDNSQINHLTAHNGDSFFLVLMNESPRTEFVNIRFNPKAIDAGAGDFEEARFLAGGEGELRLRENAAGITLPARGMVVLAVDGLDIEIAAHQDHPAPGQSEFPGFITIPVDDEMEIRAAAIQVKPGSWDGYVWSTAGSRELKEIRLAWKAGDDRGEITDDHYPYEFSVPVPAGEPRLDFTVKGVRADGSPFETEEQTIGVAD